MSGLGIVLEEADSPAVLRKDFQEASDTAVEEETLLPPLLHELDTPDQQISFIGPGGLTASVPSPVKFLTQGGLFPVSSRSSNDDLVIHSLVISSGISSEIDEFQFDFTLLSSPALEPPTPMLRNFLTLLISLSTHPTQQTTSTTSSLLNRLKILKKGIRKLSLSRIGSLMSLAGSVSALSTEHSTNSVRLSLSPVHADSINEFSSLSSDCESSPLSMYSGMAMRKASYSCSAAFGKQAGLGECANHITQAHSTSTAQALPLKSRRRTLSLSQTQWSGAGLGFALHIITLTDNLDSSGENLSSVDQSFFESLNHSPMSTNTTRSEINQHEEAGDALSKLNTPEDLFNYLIYLIEHKKSVQDAFFVAKERLLSSGWCSKLDIENLNLQRDVSLSQIDTKLLQVEEKLYSEFHLSILNNVNVPVTESCLNFEPARECMSPSLKSLERKFILFSLQQQGLHST